MGRPVEPFSDAKGLSGSLTVCPAVSPENDSAGIKDPQELGAEVGAVIRERVQAVLAEAESKAAEIEKAARQRGERAAEAYEAAAREKVAHARRKALDAAQTRAAAMIHEAENDAAEARRRAMDDAARIRERAVQEAERAASRAKARLLKYTDGAQEDLTALIAGIRREAGAGDRQRRSGS